MELWRYLGALVLVTGERVRTRVAGDDRERGDVPGWVMVTVITMTGLRRH